MKFFFSFLSILLLLVSIKCFGWDNSPNEVLNNSIDKQNITIFFRWNKSELDSLYLSNNKQLNRLDSLLTSKKNQHVNSLMIIAFASPEGHPDYNKTLSENRANTIRSYIIEKYKDISPNNILKDAKGENWEGLVEMVQNDPKLPSREKVLDILNSSMTDMQKQSELMKLDNGKTYYNYIFPKYYRLLRSGASILLFNNPSVLKDEFQPALAEPEILILPVPGLSAQPTPEVVEQPIYSYARPFALKTNLLFDAATLFNVEMEIPVGKHFSLAGEWIFPWWGGLGNNGGVSPVPVYSEKYTMQVLSGSLELRYWFPHSKRLDAKTRKWSNPWPDFNPLCGWFIGPYVSRGLYDFQFGGDGLQGEFFNSAGLSIGFAYPVGKFFHMEYALGVGYLQTNYKRYTPLDGHKVYQYDGRYSWLGPTKAKISLVWIPRFKIESKKGGKK